MSGAQNNKPLTTKAIEHLKPDGSTLADIGEYRGLRIRSGKSAKTFFYRYRSPITGKLVQVKIGNFPSIGLQSARNRFSELKQIRDSGLCPAQELKKIEEQQQAAVCDQLTIKDMVDLYLKEYIEDKRLPNGKIQRGARKSKGQADVRRSLYNDPVRTLGNRPAISITRKDVVDLIKGIAEDRGAEVQAGNVLRELTAAFDFAIGHGSLPEDFVNPAILAKSAVKQMRLKLTPTRGNRVLDDRELSQLLQWLPGSAFTPNVKNILRLTLWTGCRTGEVCTTAWKDYDLDRGTLLLRETKNGADRYVQLSTQAVDFLKGLKLQTGNYPFESARLGQPVQQKQLSISMYNLRNTNRMIDLPAWTPHDLRRTVRTGLSRLGCPTDVAEAILGHSKKGIEGTYNLHRYEDECREWLQRWADHLDGLLSDSHA